MKIGYARVSTADQHLYMQEDALKNAGCEEVYTDVASGAKSNRPGLEKALEYLRDGDTLVVWKLDRLGRSIKHLIQAVNDLQNQNIAFQSLQENIDTSTSGGKLIFHIFSALAEFERDLIQERTQAGLKATRVRGRMGGRPPLLDKRQINRMIEMYDEQKNTVAEICKIYDISRPSFYNYLKKQRAELAKAETATVID
ncbi:MAG: recombinase family protein [Gammaproteobacteria bacterium]|jgi:DNA invertase Pin-like site-specific DNA recombinase|nr:recombinase family protein [Gammaproteobacteria bacterium]